MHAPMLAGTNARNARTQRTHAGPVPDLMQVVMYFWPEMYKALFGRFLLLQLSNSGNVVTLNVQLALLSFVGRIADRSFGGLALKAMYGSRAADAFTASREMTQLRTAQLVAAMISDHVGILASAAIYYFGGVSSCVRVEGEGPWRFAGR